MISAAYLIATFLYDEKCLLYKDDGSSSARHEATFTEMPSLIGIALAARHRDFEMLHQALYLWLPRLLTAAASDISYGRPRRHHRL